MARIPQTVIDDIRERSNIVDVVGQYVQLKKSGKNYFGLCPFHNEKSPSFSVAEDKQIFHCFGCGRGGNVFGFLQELEGISFPEAVVKTAELNDIPLDPAYAQAETVDANSSQTSQLIALHEKALDVYHHMLVNTAAGQEALDYLLGRGLTMELIDTFKIGFAPNERSFLEKVFLNEKANADFFPDTGLFVQRNDGSLADRFYQRIMFPIRNPQGKTIGFSGRWLASEKVGDQDQPKYLNSPETPLFNKREVLFNFDKARRVMRKDGQVFLFEGFMDVIAAWQAGIENGIASMGTSLTNQQIAAIERAAEEVVLCYDGDQAGVEATNRGIDLLQSNSRLRMSVVRVPERLDPDEYLRKYGPEALYKLAVHGKETVFAFKMDYHRTNRNLANEKEQLDYVQVVLQDLQKVDSLLEQDRYLTQLSTEFQISRETLQQQLRQSRKEKPVQPIQPIQPPLADTMVFQPPARKQVKTQVEKAQELLLYRLFHDETLNHRFRTTGISFIHDRYQQLYLLFDAFMETEEQFVLAKFLDFLQETTMKNMVIEIADLNVSDEGTDQEFQDILQVFQKSGIAEEINQKRIQQQEARQKGNQQLELELAIEIIELTKRLKQAN
ncbi:DNA primase [Enterococcus sp. 8G7_MSG3316]|uniref:DNA primase n=1 Tax=Candidatus Enterococcus testudinis TaxID=1834191 RepID=A0A242A8T6_9ENTE|nr:DNA primase [Enterococcus sp. 8G7_MSG3316]OTN77141.1 DNA primase [Enterococcus sp. 8G7_MSG3316]